MSYIQHTENKGGKKADRLREEAKERERNENIRTETETDTGTQGWSGLRWMEKKTAGERQDNFSHFSVGGQRGRRGQRAREREKERERERYGEVERDRVTQRKKKGGRR